MTPRGVPEAVGWVVYGGYEDVQAKAGLQGSIVDLDDWLCGLAKFVLVPEVLLEDPAGQQQMRADRVALCAEFAMPGLCHVGACADM